MLTLGFYITPLQGYSLHPFSSQTKDRHKLLQRYLLGLKRIVPPLYLISQPKANLIHKSEARNRGRVGLAKKSLAPNCAPILPQANLIREGEVKNRGNVAETKKSLAPNYTSSPAAGKSHS